SVLPLLTMAQSSGYETNDSQQPRQTSCVTTPVQLSPGMIQPSQDSWRSLASLNSLTCPSSATVSSTAPSSTAPSHGRAQFTSRSNNECQIVRGHIVPNKAPNCKTTGSQKGVYMLICVFKSGITASQASEAASCMDLQQDSDKENARICKHPKPSKTVEEEYDNIDLYFEPPVAVKQCSI
ncbi:hypothetical protein DFH28DRAFT_893236, partial [Melampsora americana]